MRPFKTRAALLTVEEGAQVLHVANVLIRRATNWANMLEDLFTEAFEDSRMLAQ